MDQPTPEPIAPQLPAPLTLEAGTYEIIHNRLRDQSEDLRSRLAKLNELRKSVFGSVETVLLQADRITTEHNCVPRDMVAVSEDTFLFGYNVQFGLKTAIQLSDVFAVFKLEGGHFQQIGLDLIRDSQFDQDFQSLYKYYKNTVFVKFSFIGPFLFMVFRVGKSVTDVKTFKWTLRNGTLTYLDNRSDHEFHYPAQHEFDWKRVHRELHRSGLHPHISIEERVFVECIHGDLTIKIEDNTATGEGIYAEAVDYKDQTLDDAEIYYAVCGNLIPLKIRPFQEKAYRYFVFNDKLKRVRRVDGIADACVLLPENQGIIFSNGYYLQTGLLKLFDSNRTEMMFERLVRSANGEDFLYVFHNRLEGDYVLMSYNLITQQVDNPIACHGFSLFENGHLVYFKAQSEPQKHHTLQIWQTPYVAAGLEKHALTESFLYKIGNRDVVRCMAECQDILNLAAKDENYEGLYVDIAHLANDVVDSYFWVGQREAFHLKEALLAIRETAGRAIDEHQKVVRMRREAAAAFQRVRGKATELVDRLRRDEFRSLDVFVEGLVSLRVLRGEAISLKELRYMNLEELRVLEDHIGQQIESLSQRCVAFLLQPQALDAYRAAVDKLRDRIDTVAKVAAGRELEVSIAQSGAALELLIEIVTNLNIADATESTRILDGITSIYGTLNQAKGALRQKVKSLMGVESSAQFGAELKLLNQAVASYLDLSDSPAKCEAYQNKLMVQMEELEGRFADFEEFTIQLADKRAEVYEAFDTRKLNLVEARQRKAGALMASAERILKVVGNRLGAMRSVDEINGYMASDLMIEKIRNVIRELMELDDSVKADDLQGRLKSLHQDAVRQLKDKLELFADGQNVIRLGQHHFSINIQPLDLTLVHHGGELCLHLAGTKFFEAVRDPAFMESRQAWDQESVSENQEVYRAEYLAHLILESLAGSGDAGVESFLALDEGAQLECVHKFMGPRHAEGYSKGIHDLDAAAILRHLAAMHISLGLAKYPPRSRACAMVFWNRFCQEPVKSLWGAKLKSVGMKNRRFPGTSDQEGYTKALQSLIAAFVDSTSLYPPDAVPDAAAYLFDQVARVEEPNAFVISREAFELCQGFNEHLLKMHWTDDFGAARRGVGDHAASELQVIRDWLRGFMAATTPAMAADYVEEAAALFLCDAFDPRAVANAASRVEIAGLRGAHALIQDGVYRLDYLDFQRRLARFQSEAVPVYHRYHALRKAAIQKARDELRLDEFKPRVLTSFVRNRLIDQVYLPLIGDNLAKQIGVAGDKKRTDLMGLLLLISPPGYGKTTLMEYVANRLGIIFMKIGGPALGHQVTSLDPAQANNEAAREEVRKLNLALEMGDNIMLYLDDIQHCHAEFLQKFISLCDAQRKIEGVYRGRSRTYDLRGRKVVVVMAGNPYTESGEKFKIPDMLANRADTYNLGDILGGHEETFRMSYLENAVTSNSVLRQLANKSQADVQTFIQIAQTDSREHAEFQADYAPEEVDDIVRVMKKLLLVREAVLTVNREYIRSAGQAEAYRTEPAFKLQGSYRNMNRMAEKILPIMTEQEVRSLVIDHYTVESQTLTTGAETNLLKFKELLGLQTEIECQRWSDIKKTFQRHQFLGSADPGDPVGRVVAQLSAFADGLGGIREALQHAAAASKEAPVQSRVHVDLTPLADPFARLAQGLDALQSTLAASRRDLARQHPPVTPDDLQAVTGRIESINADLAEIRALLQQYREEEKTARALAEEELKTRALDLSGIAVTQQTLNQIYQLIDQDEKAAERKSIKPPGAPTPRSKK